MKLIFIYGPPAVGKLTVAEELVKLHDYRLFHNHLTLDLVRNIYPEFNQQMFVLADKLRIK
jgi:tRNA uridine 5-carbamoylmethylation protein Kti12